MRKLNKKFFIILLFLLFVLACAPTSKKTLPDVTSEPDEVHIFSIPPESTSREIRDNKPDILKGFPFISAQPVTNFAGKFPPEFYAAIKHRWNAEYIRFVDFWNLRHNPYLYDVIYITPLWIGDLSLKDEDFLKNIAYSYNIPDEQLKILNNWIENGGILWIESAIFISSYDYHLNNFDDKKLKKLTERLKSMTLFGKKLNVRTFKAKKIDEFNTEKLVMEITPEKIQDMNGLKTDIKKLLLEQTDYVGIYVTADGNPIVKSGDIVYASYVNHGKGDILTLVPFDFKNVRYDGEIFRLDLLSWALNGRK